MLVLLSFTSGFEFDYDWDFGEREPVAQEVFEEAQVAPGKQLRVIDKKNDCGRVGACLGGVEYFGAGAF